MKLYLGCAACDERFDGVVCWFRVLEVLLPTQRIIPGIPAIVATRQYIVLMIRRMYSLACTDEMNLRIWEVGVLQTNRWNFHTVAEHAEDVVKDALV